MVEWGQVMARRQGERCRDDEDCAIGGDRLEAMAARRCVGEAAVCGVVASEDGVGEGV